MSDETDLFDRLFAAGWVGWYEPAARAWHDQWRTRRQRIRLSWLYGFGAGARVAKLGRTDRRRAGRLAAEVYWYHGAFADGRRGYATAFVLDVTHLAGAVCGLCRALPIRVVNGHFAPGAQRDEPQGDEHGQTRGGRR